LFLSLLLPFLSLFFFLLLRRPPISTLFPYTTLFRSFLEHQEHITVHHHDVGFQAAVFLDVGFRRVHVPDRVAARGVPFGRRAATDRKSTRLNSSHVKISYAVFCLKKKKKKHIVLRRK